MDLLQETLRQLRPDSPDWYGWAKVDKDGNKIPNNERMCYEHTISIKDGVTKPTKKEFEAKYQEVKANYELQQVNRKRQSAYQAESDPLFFKYQAGEATEQDWLDKRNEIKVRFPKE